MKPQDKLIRRGPGERPVKHGPKPNRKPEIIQPDNGAGKKGWVLAGNPTNSPLVPVPVSADLPLIVRTARLRWAYNIEKNDKPLRMVEITVPIDIVRTLQLEVGMDMLFQCYGDGRIMITRAGMYVEPEARDL